MIDEAAIRLRWDTVGSRLDERGRRLLSVLVHAGWASPQQSEGRHDSTSWVINAGVYSTFAKSARIERERRAVVQAMKTKVSEL